MKTFLNLIAASTLLAAVATAQRTPRYTVTDLGTLCNDSGTSCGTYSFPFGINDAGEVAGAAATPAQTDGFAATAFLWTRQKGMTNLGILGPPAFPACPTCNSGGAGVGAAGEVAMGSEIATLDPNGEDFGQWEGPFLPPTHRITRGAIWRNGVKTVLPNLPGGNNANAFWINNAGQVSGFAENGTFDSSCSQVTPFQVQHFQPVIWGPNGAIQRVLSPLVSKGDTVAFALTINDHGQTVGGSGLCSTIGLPPFAIPNTTAAHAVLWEKDGSIHDLGSLGGAGNIIANSINNRGEVVGGAQSPKDGTLHAFLWTRQTGMLDYGAFPGAVSTVVGCCHTNNDRGEIVGFSVEPDNPYFGRALIWQGTEPKDLNDFVRAPSPFVQLVGVSSINNAGEIIGTGVTKAGEIHAFLATPRHGADEDDREDVSAHSHEAKRPIVLSDDARKLLQQRLRLMRPR
jgi:probable HAF family extracellular repeat protein